MNLRRLYIRILILALSLGGLFWLKTSVNPSAIQNAFLALGIELDASGAMTLQPSSRRQLAVGEYLVNLCPSRIVSIEVEKLEGGQVDGAQPSSILVFEKIIGLKSVWFRQTREGREEEINSVGMEKWLSSHCQTIAEKPQSGGTAADRAVGIRGPEVNSGNGGGSPAEKGKPLKITFTTVKGDRLVLVSSLSAPTSFRVGDANSVEGHRPDVWGFEQESLLGSIDLYEAIAELEGL